MIVTEGAFQSVLDILIGERRLGLDTETTGLRPYHGDRIFSLILATEKEAYYFNFQNYPGLTSENVLTPGHIGHLNQFIFEDPNKIYFIQNAANFDMSMLKTWGVELAGEIHCTKAIGRVVYNDHQSFSLENQLERIGLAKDMSVDEYIEKHQLFTVMHVPGKAQKVKHKHFDQVPFEMISSYGEKDGTGVYALGVYQERKIQELDAEKTWEGRALFQVFENEKRLQKTIFRMKDVGVKIDKDYCKKAAAWEEERSRLAGADFKAITGRDYQASTKLFQEIFKEQKSEWRKTKKGNPSFDSDALEALNHPAARAILTLRDAKSKADFYHGFLYHADRDGAVHPNLNPEGTVHGRFSSSEPNFQNLTSEDDEEQIAQEFIVRRAIIPRDGYVFVMPDMSQVEYKFALEMACILGKKLTALGVAINNGFDFHDATKARVKEVTGQDYPRKTMKIANFLTLYGGGVGKLSKALGISGREAGSIRSAIKAAAPEIDSYIQTIMRVAEERKFIVNWFGRRCYFPYRSYSYRAPNYHISGGCADILKISMNNIDEYLLGKKSRMVMSIHDELVLEVHESEIDEVPGQVKEFMERAYPSKYIPLTATMKWSAKSLADTIKGFPGEPRDKV